MIEEINEKKTREQLQQECAPIFYNEIERFFAKGMVVLVARNSDIIDVALMIQDDNAQALKKMIDDGQVVRAHDEHAIKWSQQNAQLMAVTAVPWVLVQEI